MKQIVAWVLVLALVCACCPAAGAVTEGGYTYEIVDGGARITGYEGEISGTLEIPGTLGGYPVVAIGEDAFFDRNELVSLVMPDTVTEVESWAFFACDNLRSITLSSNLTEIGEYAFYWCEALEEVHLPDSLRSIGEFAFSECYSLTGFAVSEENPYFSVDDRGVLFDKEKTTLVSAPGGLTGSYTIPEGVKTIGYGAVVGCLELTGVSLPESLLEICPYNFSRCDQLTQIHVGRNVEYIGEGTFGENAQLTGIWVDEENTQYSSDDRGVLFTKDKCELLQAPGGLAGSYTVPDSVEYIGSMAFYSCTQLEAVDLGSSVQSIAYDAFGMCSALRQVRIGAQLTYIEWNVFNCCEALSDVYYDGTAERWETIEISEGNEYLTEATIHFGEEMPELPEVPDGADAVGDLDGVAGLDEDDAIYLLQHVLMPDYFPVEQDADFDGSGEVDEDDAIYLLQHVLMPDMFPL